MNHNLYQLLSDAQASLAGYRRELDMAGFGGGDQPCDAEKAIGEALIELQLRQADTNAEFALVPLKGTSPTDLIIVASPDYVPKQTYTVRDFTPLSMQTLKGISP